MLDSEDSGVQGADADAHMAGCASCRAWYDAAARVTRLARLTSTMPEPDLVSAVLSHTRAAKPPRTLLLVRIALVFLGVAQLVVTAFQLWAPQAAGHGAMAAGAMHLEHESAAWGFALAAGFCWIAWQTRRASGLVPVLGVFILVLSVLVAVDLRGDAVTLARAASHGLLVIGFALVVYVSRVTGRQRRPRGGTRVAGPIESEGVRPSSERSDYAA